MFLPMENQEPGECLRRDFDSPAQRALHSAVWHENNVLRLGDRVGSLPRQDLSQVNRGFLSFTALLIGADDSRFALRRSASEALAQGQRLQDGNLLIRLQSESAGSSHLTDHVNNPGTSDLDDVARMNQGIVARISR